MAVRLLIDGYNLLHQSQHLGNARGPKWLLLARERLIHHVARLLDESERSRTQFVFDVRRRKSSAPLDTVVEGMRISFAVDHCEADDLIETIIRQHPHPKQLTVVSSDHRLQRCALARRASAIDSDVWLDELKRRIQTMQSTIPQASETAEDKPEATSDHVRQVMKSLGYEPPTPASEEPTTTESIVTSSTEQPPVTHSKPKPPRLKKSTPEERSRAKRRVEGEFPSVDSKSQND